MSHVRFVRQLISISGIQTYTLVCRKSQVSLISKKEADIPSNLILTLHLWDISGWIVRISYLRYTLNHFKQEVIIIVCPMIL